MIVTINTDASFYPIDKVGGFAYWIVYAGIRTKHYGPFKGKIDQPVEAELKAIANALSHVRKLMPDHVTMIIINTDCSYGIDIVEGRRQSNSKAVKITAAMIQKYLSYWRIQHKVTHEFRYVKAHTDGATPRLFVNNWCDQHAKAGAAEAKRLKLNT